MSKQPISKKNAKKRKIFYENSCSHILRNRIIYRLFNGAVHSIQLFLTLKFRLFSDHDSSMVVPICLGKI